MGAMNLLDPLPEAIAARVEALRGRRPRVAAIRRRTWRSISPMITMKAPSRSKAMWRKSASRGARRSTS
jgi:hypothetical protein